MILPNANESNAAPTGPTGVTGRQGLGALQSLAGFGLSMTPAGSLPGAQAALGYGINQDFEGFKSSILGSFAATAVNRALPGVPLAGSLVGTAAREAMKESPNYGAALSKAALSGVSSLLGFAFGGPIGAYALGTAADIAAGRSLKDGYLGDAFGTRSREKARDAVEASFGFGVSDTKGMSATQDAMDAFGIADRGFGLDAAFGSTTAGQLSAAAEDAFGLKGYVDKIGYSFGDDNDSGYSGKGTGWGGTDRGSEADSLGRASGFGRDGSQGGGGGDRGGGGGHSDAGMGGDADSGDGGGSQGGASGDNDGHGE